MDRQIIKDEGGLLEIRCCFVKYHYKMLQCRELVLWTETKSYQTLQTHLVSCASSIQEVEPLGMNDAVL